MKYIVNCGNLFPAAFIVDAEDLVNELKERFKKSGETPEAFLNSVYIFKARKAAFSYYKSCGWLEFALQEIINHTAELEGLVIHHYDFSEHQDTLYDLEHILDERVDEILDSVVDIYSEEESLFTDEFITEEDLQEE